MIFHIAEQAVWEDGMNAGIYLPASFSTEGFIHCSTRSQLLGVANELYRGKAGLLLLGVAEEKVPAKIIYEDCYETGQQFPHIYGPLPVAAVHSQQPSVTATLPQNLSMP